ncbi:MAG: ATP-binding protein, partial [Geobacteraceae bacterium]|nr:ATP-binding protein [Geobacteraceae bacterium]
KVANLLQPPKASLHNAKEWLESKEKLETLIVKEDVRNLLLASIDNGLHSIDESFEVINKLKIAVRENKMPSWHPVSDLLKIVDVDYVFAHNIRIKPSITTGSPGLELQVDKELFGTVMQNLVENAVDALRNQGNRSPDIQIQVNDVGSSPHGCTIVVQDNGPGITKENQEKIYQPWFSTKSTGSGMGLFIVQQFMMETGGTLVHETNTAPEKPTFTRFKLHFPGSRVRIVG